MSFAVYTTDSLTTGFTYLSTETYTVKKALVKIRIIRNKGDLDNFIKTKTSIFAL